MADPSGSWTPSTAEAYIDSQIATVTTDITNEVIARQNGDRNLQTQLNSEMATRADQDANLNALINAGIREGGGVQFDTVPTQNSANGITSGGMYSTLRDPNVGFVDDEPTAGSDNLVKSGGVANEIDILSHKLIPIDKTVETLGGLLYSTGDVYESSNPRYRYCAYFFRVDGVSTIRTNAYSSGSFSGIVFYANDKTTVVGTETGSSSSVATIAVPSNAIYVRICTEYYDESNGLFINISQSQEVIDKTAREAVGNMIEITDQLTFDAQNNSYILNVLNSNYDTIRVTLRTVAVDDFIIAAAYDSGNNLICTYQRADNVNNKNFDFFFDLDKNVSYLRLNYRTSNTIKIYGINDGYLLYSTRINYAPKYFTYNVDNSESLLSILDELQNNKTSRNRPSKNCHYTINIAPGVYNVDVSNTSHHNITIQPFVTLKGSGKDVTILQYLYEGNDGVYDNDIMTQHSGINASFTCMIEDLCVEVKNIRYAVHSDSGIYTSEYNYNNHIVVNRCKFIHHGYDSGVTSTYMSPNAWGSGIRYGSTRTFNDVTFISPFAPFFCHNSPDMVRDVWLAFNNCTFIQTTKTSGFTNPYNYADVVLADAFPTNEIATGHATFTNCIMDRYIYISGDDNPRWDVITNRNNLVITEGDSARKYYRVGNSLLVHFNANISCGSPVYLTDIDDGAKYTNSVGRYRFVGILLHNVDVNSDECGYVAPAGTILPMNMFGSFSAGDLIGYNGTDWIVDNNNPLLCAITPYTVKVL